MLWRWSKRTRSALRASYLFRPWAWGLCQAVRRRWDGLARLFATAFRPVLTRRWGEQRSHSLSVRQPLFGRAWIDADMRIHVENPPDLPGIYPVLIPPDSGESSVRLRVNGQIVTGEVVVEEGDRIVLEGLEEAPAHSASVTVDEAGTVAMLTVHYAPGVRHVIDATEARWRLEIHPRPTFIPPEPIPVADVLDQMDRMGIRSGRVAEEEIQRFLDRLESGSLTVARGISPTPAKAASYQRIPVPPASRRYGWLSLDDDDYVVAGTIVGIRQSGVAATPGLSVWGTVIPAPADEPDNSPVLGVGVTPLAHGPHLVAARNGRLVWLPDRIDVVPEHVREGDVVGEVVSFDGDIVIQGSVSAGAVVVATGYVIIGGDVADSEVVAGGILQVFGDAKQAKLSQGHPAAMGDAMSRRLSHLGACLVAMGEAVGQVAHQFENRPVPLAPVMKWLTEVKFPEYLDLVRALDLARRQAPHRNHPEFRAHMEPLLPQLWPDALARLPSVAALTELGQSVQAWARAIGGGLGDAPDGYLKARHLQSVSARSQGPMTIASAANCQLVSESTIQAAGRIVGGLTQAARAVRAQILGSEEGSNTVVEVEDSQGRVESQTAFPGLEIAVGRRRQQISAAVSDIIFDGS